MQIYIIYHQLVTTLHVSAGGRVSADGRVPRVPLAPAEACNYQPYHHHLSCHCQGAAPGQGVASTFLPLHLEYWVTTMGQQVPPLTS